MKVGIFTFRNASTAGFDGKDAMEFREEPLISHFIWAPFFFIWSLVIYAFATSCYPFSDSVVSHLAYYAMLSILSFFWTWMFSGTFRTRKFAVRPGLIDQCDTVLFVFRFRCQYALESVKGFVTEFKSGVMTSGYEVMLVSQRGKRMNLLRFHSQQEAEEFCQQIKGVFYQAELKKIRKEDAAD